MKHRTPKEVADTIASVLRDHGYTALFAGGCVRDELLGRSPKDYDVATDATPADVVKLFRRTEAVGAKFGVVLVRLGGQQTEVATFRSDGAYLDGRHPAEVTFTTPEADAARRDFTINGMFLDPKDGRIIDTVGGRQDLADRLIRAIGDPHRRFEEDRLRMLRAVRFATRLGFSVEEETAQAIREHAARLAEISRERILMEVVDILSDVARARGWQLLVELDLASQVVPGMTFSTAEQSRVATRLEALPDHCPWPIPLATLLHRQTPTQAASLCKRMMCSNAVVRDVGWLLNRLAFFVASEDWELADLKTLRADQREPHLRMLVESELVGRGEPLALHKRLTTQLDQIDPAQAAPPPLLAGDDLKAMGVPPGPIFSVILDRLYRDQLNGRIATPAQADSLARTLLAEQPQ